MRPFVSRILLFPIKALDGLEPQQARVLPSGALQYDRRWGLFDGGGLYVNGKRYAQVHRLRSRVDLDRHILTVWTNGEGPDLASFAIDDARDQKLLEGWLARYFGFPVTLREDTRQGFPDDTDSPGPTIVSTATLREIGSWFGLTLPQVRARLRANIEVDGVPAFWEDGLFGAAGTTIRFRVGDVTLEGINPCQRCVVPARDPLSGANDETFARRFVELRSRTLPPWSTRERFNHYYRVAINTRLNGADGSSHVRVGDAVEVIDRLPHIAVPAPAQGPADYWSGDLIVDTVRDETPTVRSFRLRHPNRRKLPFRFAPGQFITITTDNGAETLQRCYTIASSPTEQRFCELTVKREGMVSSLLHGRLLAGTRLAVSGPLGQFTIDPHASDRIVFIAGGVGITPIMSQIRFLQAIGWRGGMDLFYSVKTSSEIVFRDELEALQADNPRLRLHLTVTAEDVSWTGRRGRVTPDWISSLIPDLASCQVRLCGPAAMTAPVHAMLMSLGVPEAHFAAETFGGGSGPRPDLTLDHEVRVRFVRSGLSVAASAQCTLLDIALDNGVAVDHGCRAGVCGRCRVRLVEGEVAGGGDLALAPADKAAGFVLCCQSRPLGSVALEI